MRTDLHYVPDVTVLMSKVEVLNKALEKMWSIEILPMDEATASLTKDENIAVERIKEVMRYDKNLKRLITGLLWRDQPDLKNNYHSGEFRLVALMWKLRKEPQLK